MLTPTVETAEIRGRGYGLMGSAAGGAFAGLSVLATGPVATVYAGQLAGAEVAVKVFADRFDRDTAAWLDRERQALNTVRSVRSILPIDGVVEHPDGRSGVRMDLCQGSLAGFFETGGVSLAVGDVLRVGSAVATALAAAHGAGVVHGGVTPHNVLYRRSGELVLADFGLALRERFPRDPVYALEYTSPETLRDDIRSVESDLYGLGAVLYAALTGAPPFPRRTGQPPGERILRVLREPVPPVQAAGVPAELSDVVGRLLAKDPEARPADAASVAALFEHLNRMMAGPPPAPVQIPVAPPVSIPVAPPVQTTVAPPVQIPVPPPVQVPVAPPVSQDPGPTVDFADAGDLHTDHQPRLEPDRTPDDQDSPGDPDEYDYDFDDFGPAQQGTPVPGGSFQPAAPLGPNYSAAPVAPMPPVAPVAPVRQAAPRTPVLPTGPGRSLVYVAGGGAPATGTKRKLHRNPWMLVGIGVAVAALTVVPIIAWPDSKPAQPTPAAAPPAAGEQPDQPPNSPAAPKINLELAPPVDRGSQVELSWRADGDLDFAVIVAGERIDTMILTAHRQRTFKVSVDPTRRYCFQVRATDSRHVYTTDPVAIRGAVCKL